MSEHAQRQSEVVRATVDAALRATFSERGVDIWWRTPVWRLGMLTPLELLDLGCHETLHSECSRATGCPPQFALRNRDQASTLEMLRELLRLVTDQDMQVSER